MGHLNTMTYYDHNNTQIVVDYCLILLFWGGAITFYFKEIVFMLVNMKFTNLLDQWEHEHFLISIIVVTSLEPWPNCIAGTVPKWPQTRELFDIYMLF